MSARMRPSVGRRLPVRRRRQLADGNWGGVSACLFSSSAKIRGLGVFGIVSTNFPLEAARSFSCSTYALQASVRPSRSYSHQDDHDRDAKDGQTGESSHHQPMALTGVVTRTVDR